MTRVTWGAPGKRFFETGVDRGVLFMDDKAGVPWNGLVAVNETPVGGDTIPYYIDGFKYLNRTAREEFEATIEAFTYPEEFEVCDGSLSMGTGLFATQQPRKAFTLAYRSLVGNDVDGVAHAYKIHIIYNALVAPSTRNHQSIGDSVDPDNFSWKVTTKAPGNRGYRPSAHFMIDSRKTPSGILQTIEDLLYGTSTSTPRVPSVQELIFIFNSDAPASFDAGIVGDAYFITFDGGATPTEAQTSTIDGGVL